MDKQTAFYFLLATAGLCLIVIFALSHMIQNMVKSDSFRDMLIKRKNDQKNIQNVILVLLSLAIPSIASAASPVTVAADDPMINVTSTDLWILGMVNLVLMGVIYYLTNLLKSLINYGEEPVVVKEEKEPAAKTIARVLTDRVAMEDEESILMDHDYDGIQELDNNLPPWWKWGFYLTIFIGVIYMIHFHVLGTGDLQAVEYEKEMAAAQIEIDEYLAKQALNVDENTVTVLTDAANLKAGKDLFMTYCKVCHGEFGEGMTGPNFTDDYWLYGNRINDIFRTVKYGAENGMRSWQDEFSGVEIQQVASFISSLYGTNPPNPKAAQGDFYAPIAEESDSTAVDMDTTNVSADTLDIVIE